MTEEPTPPRELRPDLPEAVEAVVLRALAKEPADRWQTAGEMARAFRLALEREAQVRREAEERASAHAAKEARRREAEERARAQAAAEMRRREAEKHARAQAAEEMRQREATEQPESVVAQRKRVVENPRAMAARRTTAADKRSSLKPILAVLLGSILIIGIAMAVALWVLLGGGRDGAVTQTRKPTHAVVVEATATTSTLTATATPPPAPAQPNIAFFQANPGTIFSGECSTLEWGAVTGATGVQIDQGIGGVAVPGSLIVCPTVTTTYVMTAVGPGGTATAQITVAVRPGQTDLTITLTSQPSLDGFRTNNTGGNNTVDIRVGNGGFFDGPSKELVIRGFMSFDLTGIPATADIKSIELRFYQVTVTGTPYAKLGNPLMQHVDYDGTLDNAAYDTRVLHSAILSPHTGAGEWYTITASTVADWIESDLSAGRTRFQLRLQFSTETDDDGIQDTIIFESGDNYFGTGNLPQLIITYAR